MPGLQRLQSISRMILVSPGKQRVNDASIRPKSQALRMTESRMTPGYPKSQAKTDKGRWNDPGYPKAKPTQR